LVLQEFPHATCEQGKASLALREAQFRTAIRSQRETGVCVSQVNLTGLTVLDLERRSEDEIVANHFLCCVSISRRCVDGFLDLSGHYLAPPGFNESSAAGISGGQQVGWGKGSVTGGNRHALLWTGTAASCVDPNPIGFDTSQGLGVGDGQQVGTGRGSATGNQGHALLWSGTAESYVDLHSLLPTGYYASYAYAIDSAGNIVGDAYPDGGAVRTPFYGSTNPT
jgi:hypothetical protein